MVRPLQRLRNGWITGSLLLGGSLVPSVAVLGQSADPCSIFLPPPVITGTASLCRGETAVLVATGCSGTVLWSTGETGDQLRVKPLQTTRYTAICRTPQGCFSCFADAWQVKVQTPPPPVVTVPATPVCEGDTVTLRASGCEGMITWPDGTTGDHWTIPVTRSVSYPGITCQHLTCTSAPSEPIALQVALPARPLLTADRDIVCAGQTVALMAAGCPGVVRWSDGTTGVNRSVTPLKNQSYRAVCEIGSCRSDSSDVRTITVRAGGLRPTLTRTTVTNSCPYQTADLTGVVPADKTLNPAGQWLFRTRPAPDAPAVQSAMAVEKGEYYVFLRTEDGCYSAPAVLTALITPCANAIAPCLSNPARVIVWADSLNGPRGSVVLHAQLRGMAVRPQWVSTGKGLLTAASAVTTRYLFAEADRQQKAVTFTLTTPDPDDQGPCVGAWASLSVGVPLSGGSDNTARVGLSKKVFEPAPLPNGEVELTYQLAVANVGQSALQKVQVSDNLDRAFVGAGARVLSVTVRADSNWAINPGYTGRGADTTLLLAGADLPPGAVRKIRLLVRLNVGQAHTLTFANRAYVQGLDPAGRSCRDWSANGDDPDPDRNGDPEDNSEPTVIALQSAATEGAVFIPEGFSPNNDGVNDQFVIQRVPPETTMHLRVFNRWGNLVFESNPYRNDWNGTVGNETGPKGHRLADGTYFYVLSLSNGREYSRFMTLSR